ncbi:hypothetical protein EDB87DRAFT_79388 [Lactarius vividus]|nr:hypothetical protein EDB87DRAFT_79388 [Lactarius vividus]
MVNNTELAMDGKPPIDTTRGIGEVSVQQAPVAENVNEPAMTRDQLREILRWWLSPLDQSANHNAAGKTRRSGAAEWLIQRGCNIPTTLDTLLAQSRPLARGANWFLFYTSHTSIIIPALLVPRPTFERCRNGVIDTRSCALSVICHMFRWFSFCMP